VKPFLLLICVSPVFVTAVVHVSQYNGNQAKPHETGAQLQAYKLALFLQWSKLKPAADHHYPKIIPKPIVTGALYIVKYTFPTQVSPCRLYTLISAALYAI